MEGNKVRSCKRMHRALRWAYLSFDDVNCALDIVDGQCVAQCIATGALDVRNTSLACRIGEKVPPHCRKVAAHEREESQYCHQISVFPSAQPNSASFLAGM